MSEEDLPQSDCLPHARHPRESYTLFGQQEAELAFLTAHQSDRLHHAWMITGPRGVGKATLAWRIARFILSQSEEGGMFNTPTQTDLAISPDYPIARRLASLGEPRLHLVRRPYDPERKKLKTQITVDEIRKLKSFFQLSAADGGWRVALIDAADELNASAANALLKLLEEPPEKALILMVAHQPAKLLPTIRSRCRALMCRRLSREDLDAALVDQGMSLGLDAAYIAELADGSVGHAMTLLNEDGAARYQSIANIFATLPKLDRNAAIKLAESCAGSGKEELYGLTLNLLKQYLSRLAKFGAMQPASFQEAAKEEAQSFARLAPNAHAGRKWADLLMSLDAQSDYARAVNLDPASVILDMFLEINKAAS